MLTTLSPVRSLLTGCVRYGVEQTLLPILTSVFMVPFIEEGLHGPAADLYFPLREEAVMLPAWSQVSNRLFSFVPIKLGKHRFCTS